jgi:O-antigen ligase
MVLFFAGLLIVNQLSKSFLTERFLPEQLAIGSGRTEIYRASIEEISQRSLWYLLVGYGSGSSKDYLGKVAHNEWLEFLFNFGVIGGVFYALLFLALARRLWQLIRRSSPYAPAYAMAVVYMLTVGMFGQIYFAHSTFYIMAFYGAVEGLMLNDARNAQVLSADYAQYRLQGTVK